MNKTLGFLTIICIIFITLSNPAYAEGDSLSILVDTENFIIGEEITVDIMAKDLWNIAGADIQITYDSELLELIEKNISVENAINIQNHSEGNIELEDSEETVKILFGLNSQADLLQGDNILASIKFKAIDVGQVTISLSPISQLIRETVNGDSVDYTYANPQLSPSISIDIVKLGKISGTVTSSDGYSVTGATINLMKDGIPKDSITVEADGGYEFIALEDGIYNLEVNALGYELFTEEIVILNGENTSKDIELIRNSADVNRDGAVGLEDLVFVGSKFGLNNGDAQWEVDADINQDDTINIIDLVNLTRLIQ